MREQEVRIPVRDGSRLAATLYLPDDGRGPHTAAEMVAEVERSLSNGMGFNKVA